MHNLTEIKLVVMSILGIAGSFLAVALGGWDTALQTLIIFMAVDYGTGFLVSALFKKSKKTVSGGYSSDIGFMGIAKKGVILLIVLIAHRMDLTLETEFVRNAVIIAYIINEVISITENAGLMGIPIPNVIQKGLDALSGKSEADESI